MSAADSSPAAESVGWEGRSGFSSADMAPSFWLSPENGRHGAFYFYPEFFFFIRGRKPGDAAPRAFTGRKGPVSRAAHGSVGLIFWERGGRGAEGRILEVGFARRRMRPQIPCGIDNGNAVSYSLPAADGGRTTGYANQHLIPAKPVTKPGYKMACTLMHFYALRCWYNP